jgi:folate-binding protein YgfZ
MQKPLLRAPAALFLADLGALRVQGPDAVRFLQGQLSNDVARLSSGHPLLAGLHNPQGRVVALLRLVSLGNDDILAILPRELVAAVAARLSKYILRAKVKVSEASEEWHVAGVIESADWQLTLRAQDRCVLVDTNPNRWWVVTPTGDPSGALDSLAPLDRDAWRAADIAAGLPQVYASTSEAFVAQMLNLDELGGIAFDKGCYTGQEVIARAHYRGRVKRRIQKFHIPGMRLSPGNSGTLPDGRTFQVVESVATADGGSDVLAVAPLEDAAESPSTS